jgi:hypothetical protein
MLKGRELGIPPMQAFASINVIKGKPSLSSDLMSSLVRSHGHSIRIVESTDKRCEVTGKRKDTGDSYTSVFTHEMAVKAQLPSQNQNYGKYPENMLRARAISNLCRVLFADIIMGMYTPEEVAEFDEPVKQEVVNRDYNPVPPKKTYEASKVAIDMETGEVVEVGKPKQGKKLGKAEYDQFHTTASCIWKATGVDTTQDDEPAFKNVTLDQFTEAVKKITHTNNSIEALKKYGISGSLNDAIRAKHKGEGLNMGQMLSAGLHYLWEAEQKYRDTLDTVGELVPATIPPATDTTTAGQTGESEELNFGF